MKPFGSKRIPCGHIFCKVCINVVLASSFPLCPLDRSAFSATNLTPERYLTNIIEELECYCSNKNVGCVWEGEYGSLGRHLKNECTFASVQCKDCKMELRRLDLEVGNEIVLFFFNIPTGVTPLY